MVVVIWRTWEFRLRPQTANCLHEDKSALNLQEPVFWTTGADPLERLTQTGSQSSGAKTWLS